MFNADARNPRLSLALLLLAASCYIQSFGYDSLEERLEWVLAVILYPFVWMLWLVFVTGFLYFVN